MPTIGRNKLTLHGQERISIDKNSPRISGRPQHIQCDSSCHYLSHPLNLKDQGSASPTSSVVSTFLFCSRYLSVDSGSSRALLRGLLRLLFFFFQRRGVSTTRIRTHNLNPFSVAAGPHFWITDQLHNPKAPESRARDRSIQCFVKFRSTRWCVARCLYLFRLRKRQHRK